MKVKVYISPEWVNMSVWEFIFSREYDEPIVVDVPDGSPVRVAIDLAKAEFERRGGVMQVTKKVTVQQQVALTEAFIDIRQPQLPVAIDWNKEDGVLYVHVDGVSVLRITHCDVVYVRDMVMGWDGELFPVPDTRG